MPLPLILGGLLKLAPSVIRMLGSMGGKNAKNVAGTVADIISRTVSGDKREAALAVAMGEMSGEEIIALKQLEAEAEARIREAEERTAQEIERTHQTRVRSDDVVVRRTRPNMARQSWLGAMLYGIVTLFLFPTIEGLTTKEFGMSFSIEIFLVLCSPAFTFMGVRGLERWKAGGTPH